MSQSGWQVVHFTDRDDLRDVGDDPCFDLSPPSWGICRPNIRCQLNVGQSVLFIAFRRDQQRYFTHGLFHVAELIGYTEAASRFPGRENLLLQQTTPSADAEWLGKPWRHRALQVNPPPDFLTCAIDSKGKRWYHADSDPHEIDNWKCRRIYRCVKATLERCLRKGACGKEQRLGELQYRTYIVGDPASSFVVRKETPYEVLAQACGLDPQLRKGNKHPEIRLTVAKVESVVQWFQAHGSAISSYRP
jgi:hypothetical protein